jgi:hypothetical protein
MNCDGSLVCSQESTIGLSCTCWIQSMPSHRVHIPLMLILFLDLCTIWKSVFRVGVKCSHVNFNPEDGGSMYLRSVGNTAHFNKEQSSESNFNRQPLWKSKGEGTPRKLANAISKNCYQPELNTCYWMEQRNSRKDWEIQPLGNKACQSSHNCVAA